MENTTNLSCVEPNGNCKLQSYLANRRENKEYICHLLIKGDVPAKNSNKLANAPVVCSVNVLCQCTLSPVQLNNVPSENVHCPQRDCTLSPEGLYTVPRRTVHCVKRDCTLSPEGLYPEGLYFVPRGFVPRGIVLCTQINILQEICTLLWRYAL